LIEIDPLAGGRNAVLGPLRKAAILGRYQVAGG
jgi:hypothetical protein